VETYHILVTRPSEYMAYCQNFLPKGYLVAKMPESEESVGTARFWCLEIARRLKVDWAFMLDDSLHPEAVRLASDKLSFVVAVRLFETLKDRLNDYHSKIGILSLRRFRGQNNNQQQVERAFPFFFPFQTEMLTAHLGFFFKVSIHFCQGFQFLNVKELQNKQLYFRRGLFYAEDFIFSQECCQAGLAPLMLTRIEYYDQNTNTSEIKDSGAHSPYSAPRSKNPDPPPIPTQAPDSEGEANPHQPLAEGEEIEVGMHGLNLDD